MRLMVCLMVALGAAGPVRGQDRPLPPTGQQVFVQTTASRAELKGHLLELSRDTLALLVDGRRVELPLETVLRIETRGDSLKNGALMGALVLGGWCAAVCGQGLDDRDMWPLVVAVNTAFGAAIGAGIDGLVSGRQMIYSKPSPRSTVARPPGAWVRMTVRF
jgi:hypothetical protein